MIELSDPIITPFVQRQIADGYTVKARKGGCDDLSRCEKDDRHHYVFTFRQDGVEIKKCPHCEALHVLGR